MTGNEWEIRKLMDCLEHTQEAERLAKKGIATIRQLLKNHEMAIHLKERYRKQMRMLRRIVKGTKRETELIQSLILKLRGEAPDPHETNGYAAQA
jgi:hypothetical protein